MVFFKNDLKIIIFIIEKQRKEMNALSVEKSIRSKEIVLCECGRSVTRRSLSAHKKTPTHKDLLKEKGILTSSPSFETEISMSMDDLVNNDNIANPISLFSLLDPPVKVDSEGRVQLVCCNEYSKIIRRLRSDFIYKCKLVQDEKEEYTKRKLVLVYVRAYKDWYVVGHIPPKYNNDDFKLQDGECTVIKGDDNKHIVMYQPM